MNIGVFLSATDLDELYTQPTREFGALIGRAGYPLVWGGSDTGLMKVLTDGVQASGGRLTGISVDFLRKWVRTDADEMTFARDLAERKARLLSADTNPLMLPVTPGSSSSSDAMS
jgi:predicted Rossmann-fold nucleotide-binding protein